MTLDQDLTGKKNADGNLQTRILWGIRIFLSFMFLLSAVAKLYPSPHFALTTFEFKQLIPMGFTESGAAYFSRILIGCELALGIGLLQPHFFKRLVLPLSFLMLFIFSSQLTYEIATTGNSGNCGCFGALLPMTPVQALVKNILAMGLIIYVFRFTEKANDKKDPFLISTLILGSILTIFLVGPLRQITTKVADDTEIVVEEVGEMDEPVNIDTLTVLPKTPADTLKKPKKAAPVVDEGPKKKKSGYKNWFADIDNGKKILCFFAPGCDHCKETAKELTQLKKEIADFPEIRIVFMDEEAELIPNFFEFAGAKYPYQIADVATFWQTMGTQRDTPGVFYLWNGNVIKEYDGINEKKFVKSDFKKIVTKK